MAIDKRKLLAGALIELCKEKNLSKITIHDILDKTGVSRQTFYNYFHDKNDLIHWTYFTHITGDGTQLDERGLYGFVYDAHVFCVKHKTFFTQACSMEGQNNLRDYMVQHNFENHYNLIIKKHGEKVLTDELIWAIKFNAFGAINMHLKWVKEGMPLTPEVKAKYVIDCIPGIMKQYLPIRPITVPPLQVVVR
jgi:hypothetical protein